MWRYLSVFALSALGGGILGRGLPAKASVPPAAPPEHAPPRREAPAKWGKADFQKAAAEFNAAIKARTYDPYQDLWATWTDAEIRAALDQCFVHPECLTTNGAGMGVANSLLRELLKRDTDAAVAWFDSAPFEAAKKRYVYTISAAWPQERAAAGLEFLRSHRSLFPGGIGWSIMAKNIQASAAQGPAGVEAMLTTLTDDGFSLNFGNPLQFPAGFDFRGLMDGEVWKKLGQVAALEGIMGAFRQQDPERAFAWLLEKQGVAGIGLLDWLPIEDSGSAELSWLGKKIESLDASQRAEYFEKTMGEWSRMPDAAVASFVKEARSPETRELLRNAVVQQLYAGNARSCLSALETLGHPAERIRALEEATPGEAFASGRQPMTPGDEAFIKGKLAEWNADEARIQSIVEHLKK